MGRIQKALDALEPDEVKRVVAWTMEYARGKLDIAITAPGGGGPGAGPSGGGPPPPSQFKRIGDLVDEAEPANGAEYVLVAAYWFQVLQGADNVTGLQVNARLKDLGHGVSNVTDAFYTLQERKPALARQVEKTGSHRQARKRYRLTQAGIRRVHEMLASSREDH